MIKKLIFLDIDGTLIHAMKAPSGLATEAVRRARLNGYKVFLCTGRNTAIIGEDIRKIGFDGMIASAGAYVEVEKKVLFDQILAEETIQECLAVFHANGIYCRIESPEGIYTDPQMEALLKEAQPDRTNSELIRMQREIEAGIPILPYDRYPGNGAYKICFTGTSLQSIENTQKVLGNRFIYAVHPYADSSTCLNGEIIPKGIDKGRGMEMICRYYGVDLKDTVAFGDSMNDREMMRAAGISIAMGNACEELKRMADRICGNAWEDGVYYEFRSLGFI
ncbi:Cof-type HAD-IIB family hydrolase [bacterium C-53]|nr:Cof-type HAD-IIB family hydrolase [Lachnospiraceae bacterium]NBI04431.1 Cof-type HAD-IIB family hydrolase [Lachnospiraceae bacterium]RKJ08238.1 Cof-type HAD-IIB family hydrolase [bacterium C-53]